MSDIDRFECFMFHSWVVNSVPPAEGEQALRVSTPNACPEFFLI